VKRDVGDVTRFTSVLGGKSLQSQTPGEALQLQAEMQGDGYRTLRFVHRYGLVSGTGRFCLR
jgi:hypothetical protein